MAIEKLRPGQRVGLSYTLDNGKYWRITLDVDSEGPVSVEFFVGLGAFREETAGEGGVPYAFADGKSFTVLTTDKAPGGYWFISIRNRSKFDEVVTFDSFAVETGAVEGYVPPVMKSWRETIVGWDGKPSKPLAPPSIVVKKPAEKPKHDLYAAMMSRMTKKS